MFYDKLPVKSAACAIFVTLLFVFNAFAQIWTQNMDPELTGSPRSLRGERMMVLGLDGHNQIVDMPQTSRPQPLETVFAGQDMQTSTYKGRQIHFFVKDGWAIVDGDVAIGRASDFTTGANALGFAQYKRMWPKVGSVYQVPYIITFGNADIMPVINYINTTFAGIIQWVPRTTETDYVNFQFTPGDFSGYGFSTVGRAPTSFQPQQLGGSENQSFQTLLHEMGHAMGLNHEQSRADRNTYLEFHPENMSNATRTFSSQLADYFQLDTDIQDIGLYDYASTMHYFWDNLAKKVGPVHESIPHGIQIARNPPLMTGDYSPGDIDGIKRLYDAAPSQITVTSNPPGLQVIVDGATVTTPQVYTWNFGSIHSLSVATNGQTVGGKSYVYGRWNDNVAATHNITVTGGNGNRVSPRFKPAVTVYTANFINLISYTQVAIPDATYGSMTSSPAPISTYPGLPGSFYIARQPVTLTATPLPGRSFYAWINIPLYSFGANPQTFYWDSDIANINVASEFTNAPVYTVKTNQKTDKHSWIYVDTQFFYSPVNFSPQFDAGWTALSSHTIGTDSTETPFYFNTRHQFLNWSDAMPQFHSVTLPAVSTTYTANFQTQYRTLAESPCGGTPSITPASPAGDGFYNAGTSITIGQTPDAGYFFTGWREDLTGTVTPQTLPLNDEFYAIANYNVNTTPFSVTSLSPSSAIQGSAGFTLTINGTGFTSTRTFVDVNNIFRANTFISSTQITVPVLASDLTTPGGISIFVQNFPNGAACGVYNNRVLQVKFPGPSAAAVPVSGRVTTADGSGIARAAVSITDANGVTRTVKTGSFGYFRLDEVESGGTYILSVVHKRYQFETPSRVITLSDEITVADFIALP